MSESSLSFDQNGSSKIALHGPRPQPITPRSAVHLTEVKAAGTEQLRLPSGGTESINDDDPRQSNLTTASSRQSFASCRSSVAGSTDPNTPLAMQQHFVLSSSPPCLSQVAETAQEKSPSEVTHQPRKSSLPIATPSRYRRFSSSSDLTPKLQTDDNSASTHGIVRRGSSVSPEDSRPHSPSLASFSRPRPGSAQQPSRIPSLSKQPSTSSLRSSHTASRLPISASKRATVVNVKSRNSTDHAGIKLIADESVINSASPLADLRTQEDPGKITPYRNLRRVQNGLSTGSPNYSSTEWPRADELSLLHRAPPSRSPFTAPLATIRSQHLLPTFAEDGREKPRDSLHMPTSLPVRSKLSDVTNLSLVVPPPEDKPDHDGHVRRTLHLLEGNPPGQNTRGGGAENALPCGMTDFRTDSPYENDQTSLADKATVAQSYLSTDGLEAPREVPVTHTGTEAKKFADIDESSSPPSRWSISSHSDASPGPTSRKIRHVSGTVRRPGTPMGLPEDIFKDTPPSSARHTSNARIPGLTRSNEGVRSPFPAQMLSPLFQKSPSKGRLLFQQKPRQDNDSRVITTEVNDKTRERPPTSNAKALRVLTDDNRGRRSTIANSSSKSSFLGSLPRERSRSRIVFDKINGFFSSKKDKPAKASPPPPLPAQPKNQLKKKLNASGDEIKSDGLVRPERTSSMAYSKQITTTAKASPTRSIMKHKSAHEHQHQQRGSPSPHRLNRDSAHGMALSNRLILKARQETSLVRRERMLNFARILNESMIQAREAKISAELAKTAARNAQTSYEMTEKALDMMGRLAGSLTNETE